MPIGDDDVETAGKQCAELAIAARAIYRVREAGVRQRLLDRMRVGVFALDEKNVQDLPCPEHVIGSIHTPGCAAPRLLILCHRSPTG
jgi:hypothetical protein